ncbi:curli production assembly/transport component CsgG [Zeaxanthinibacter enoshimensis]|uniref:Curli production assembly/transport component CsgG n=2 Tax=Zeaxanthinibacter enoshimensis TaxID=392009 RepID=A0A4R6TGH4_9FLAO|nr:curli production assembly/transport component CsgG [Zeaxanthinibacter enoshimensis]
MLLLGSVTVSFLSCGAYFNQPVTTTPARIGEITPKTKVLDSLPLPEKPVIVGVYNFKDQTGQYKSVENGSTFSTAVSQGATTMLIKALEDSKWFTPIERENLSHLLNERNIIRSTREEFSRNDPQASTILPPLLFAGVLLEGGVVSYDSNILTGGAGARYFGVGGAAQYRQDRLTIYLRAVSTSNGKILKTVYVSKTVLSQAVDASLFRYVSFQRLLEVETGFTKNEPVQLAMKDAIETAVHSLIVEGVEDGLWKTAGGEEDDSKLVAAYQKVRQDEESTLLYGRKQRSELLTNTFQVSGIATLFNGDFGNKKFAGGGIVGYQYRFKPHWSLVLSGSYLYFEGGNRFSKEYMSGELNLDYTFLPYDHISPYVYGGVGGIFDLHTTEPSLAENTTAIKFQYGLGVKVKVGPRMDLALFAENNITLSDAIDEVINGKRDDYYYNFGLGLHYSFGSRKN